MCKRFHSEKTQQPPVSAPRTKCPSLTPFYRRGTFYRNQYNSFCNLKAVNNPGAGKSQSPDLLSCINFEAVSHCILKTSIVLKCRKLIGIILAFVTHKLNVLLASFWLSRFPNHSLMAKAFKITISKVLPTSPIRAK